MNQINSTQQLILTGLVASLITAGTILTYQSLTSKPVNSNNVKTKVRKLNALGLETHSQPSTLNSPLPIEKDPLMSEQLGRNLAFLGVEGLTKLQSSFVVVVGLGGVGSWAALMLLRSGVYKIRVIDFDLVTLSSLNRHATATREDVGKSKVEAFKEYCLKVNPNAEIECVNQMYSKDVEKELLKGSPDFVLDCIDNLDTKIDLLKYCHTNNIKVIASMGAGAKADPSRIQIADISETQEDPLARAVRRTLRSHGIRNGIPTVYSTEKPGHVKLLPLDESKADKADDYAILPEFRSRILPVLGTLPAMFGMTLASYVICKISEHPLEPLAIKQRDGVYQRLLRDLVVKDRLMYQHYNNVPFGKNDVGFLLEEVFRSRSAISQEMDRLCLIRYNPTKPLALNNCLVLTKSEVKKHESIKDQQTLDAVYPESVKIYINERMKLLNEWQKEREL